MLNQATLYNVEHQKSDLRADGYSRRPNPMDQSKPPQLIDLNGVDMGSPFYDKRSDMRSRISSIKDGRTTRALKVQQCTSAIADVSRHIAYGLGCNEDRQKMAHLYEQLGREIEEVWRCEDLIAQLEKELSDQPQG